MSYDLQAEGINGVVSQTTVTANAEFTGPVWDVDATKGALAAVLARCNGGDGVLGEGVNGVHGRSNSPNDSGVYGENHGSGTGRHF